MSYSTHRQAHPPTPTLNPPPCAHNPFSNIPADRLQRRRIPRPRRAFSASSGIVQKFVHQSARQRIHRFLLLRRSATAAVCRCAATPPAAASSAAPARPPAPAQYRSSESAAGTARLLNNDCLSPRRLASPIPPDATPPPAADRQCSYRNIPSSSFTFGSTSRGTAMSIRNTGRPFRRCKICCACCTPIICSPIPSTYNDVRLVRPRMQFFKPNRLPQETAPPVVPRDSYVRFATVIESAPCLHQVPRRQLAHLCLRLQSKSSCLRAIRKSSAPDPTATDAIDTDDDPISSPSAPLRR